MPTRTLPNVTSILASGQAATLAVTCYAADRTTVLVARSFGAMTEIGTSAVYWGAPVAGVDAGQVVHLVYDTGGTSSVVGTVVDVQAFRPGADQTGDAYARADAALPNIAPGAAGGLPTVDSANGVKLSVGTGTGQITLATGQVSASTVTDKAGYSLSGTPAVNVTQWLGSTPNALASGKVDAAATVSLGANAPAGWINGAAFAADAISAAAVSAAAVTKVQAGLSTYAGGDTAGTATLVGLLTPTVVGRLDAAISTRSTYAGADTPGTGTLLTRVPGAVALAAQIPANLATLAIAAGAFDAAALAHAPTDVAGVVAAMAAAPVGSVAAAVTVGTNQDKAGYQLAASQPDYAPATAADFPTDYQQRDQPVTLGPHDAAALRGKERINPDGSRTYFDPAAGTTPRVKFTPVAAPGGRDVALDTA
jgi:hypothetical protein